LNTYTPTPTSNIDADADKSGDYRYFMADDVYEVGREEVRDFARAVHATHPSHWNDTDPGTVDRLVVPPTFAAKIGTRALRWLTSKALGDYPLGAFIHTDQTMDYYQPIYAGDRLRVTLVLWPIRSKAGGDIITLDGHITNQRNELVQTTRITAIGRVGQTNPDLATAVAGALSARMQAPTATWHPVPTAPPETAGPARTDYRATSVPMTAGHTFPAWHTELSLGDLVNYAGVSGDPNPIHWNPAVAGIIGLDSVIAHGLLTMGLGATYLTDLVGHPGCLQNFKVRFTGITPVAATSTTPITFTARVKDTNPTTGTATLALTATAADKRIFGRATSVVTTTTR
jgi:acyl dehydratase